MVKIKSFLIGFDYLSLSLSGYTTIDLIQLAISGNNILSTFDGFVKLLLSIAGLVYLVVRIVHSIKMNRLNQRYREQEVIEKESHNKFNRRFNKEFNEPFE